LNPSGLARLSSLERLLVQSRRSIQLGPSGLQCPSNLADLWHRQQDLWVL
jgi:hypothetical protein